MDEPSVSDAQQRLADLKQERHERLEKGHPRLWMGVLALALVALFIWLLPRLMSEEDPEKQRFEEALAYCKYRTDQASCEQRIREHYVVCARRHEKANRPDLDTYGKCMYEVFPDFYLEVGQNLPKPFRATP